MPRGTGGNADPALLFALDYLESKRALLKRGAFREHSRQSKCEGIVHDYRTMLLCPNGEAEAEGWIAYMVYETGKGTKTYHEGLSWLAAELIERGEPLPASLRAYVVNALRNVRVNKKRSRKGTDTWTLAGRDLVIVQLIHRLASDFGIYPTRNESTTETPSACSIVATGLQSFNVHLTEGAVAKIWKKVPNRAAAGGLARRWKG